MCIDTIMILYEKIRMPTGGRGNKHQHFTVWCDITLEKQPKKRKNEN